MNPPSRSNRTPGRYDLEAQIVFAYQALDLVSSALGHITRQAGRALDVTPPSDERERGLYLVLFTVVDVAKAALEATGDVASALANITANVGRMKSAALEDDPQRNPKKPEP
jgi:hypothetical protein